MSSPLTPDRTAHDSREADRIYRVAASKPNFPTPLAIHERSFPGHARSVAAVRIFVADCLLAGCPVADEAVLCASELATNALLHSASGAVGGDYRVRVEIATGSLALSVFDRGPSSAPQEWRSPDERGRGLDIVVALATAYDVVIDGKGRRAWCRLDWPAREETAHRTAAGPSPERKKDPGHFGE